MTKYKTVNLDTDPKTRSEFVSVSENKLSSKAQHVEQPGHDNNDSSESFQRGYHRKYTAD